MKRREFITFMGGAAALAARPRLAHAQQAEHIRRIGMMTGGASSNSAVRARNVAFLQAMQQLGWTEGRNLKVDYRFGTGNAANMRKFAEELVALAPEVILAGGASSTEVLQEATRTVPIVFTIVPDPVGAGFVRSLARPGGNITGFMQAEYSLTAKWLELLKQIAPGVTRAAVLRDITITAGVGQFAVIQSVAPSLGVDVSPVNIRDAAEIERDIAAFASIPNGGLILTSTPLANHYRDFIIRLAARHKLPAVYSNGSYVARGGLISYGANFVDLYRQAASYVDRVLRGEKPADLPVQAPTKYALTINIKTAKALGLKVPPSLLARADKVIE